MSAVDGQTSFGLAEDGLEIRPIHMHLIVADFEG